MSYYTFLFTPNADTDTHTHTSFKPTISHLGHSSRLFFFFNLFIYLFLAALGLRCCTRAFSSCGERGLFFISVRGLLIAVASLVVEHRL